MPKQKKKKISIHTKAVTARFKTINAAKKAKRAKATGLTKMISAARAKIVAALAAKKAAAKPPAHHTRAAKAYHWKASDHPAISIEKLRKIDTNTLEYILFQTWKGYKIAHGQNDIPKLKYYTEGIDKVTAELEGRPDITARQRRQLKKHALMKDESGHHTILPKHLPRYADGLWLREKAGAKVTIISPVAFFKK